MSRTDWQVIGGDCIEVMAGLPAGSVDALVCDPPYNLSDGVQGGFMGAEWDGWGRPGEFQKWCQDWATEALRVLKPGGHLLAFGGTRTYHRLACGIEDAGFEIRDSIMWIYGQGFPKSLDVSKAIDKALGAEREEGTPGRYASRRPREDVEAVSTYGHGVGDAGSALVTTPSTPEAAQWEGWGTALKPSQEPIVVGRKPVEGTVAANVLKHGTGAINVDGCRVAASDGGSTVDATRSAEGINKVYGVGVSKPGDVFYETPEGGRWPANLILSHAEGCRKVGTRTVKTSHGGVIMGEAGADRAGNRSAAFGAEEVIPAYECVPGCPVAEIDRQSGLGPSGVAVKRNGVRSEGVTGWGAVPPGTPDLGFGDFGGASRFFYCPKSSSEDRAYGLPPGQRNPHPTVKTIALMRYLVRLVTPPDGLVLDPFAGSGSCGIAAIREGFGYLGIEREPEYVELARTRIGYALTYLAEPQTLFG